MSEDSKGKQGGTCNRTVCNAPALWYNESTRAYYCTSCARRIQEAATPGIILFKEFHHVEDA